MPIRWVVVLCAAGGLLLWLVLQAADSTDPTTLPPSDRGGSHATAPADDPATTLGVTKPRPESREQKPPARDEEPTPDGLAALVAEASAGKPEEWPVATLGDRAAPSPRMQRVTSLVDAMAGTRWMNEPPFRTDFVFGESDLPWLERLASLYDKEIGVGQDLDAIQMGTRIDERQPAYRRALAEIAKQRLSGQPDLVARFEDGTVLRDIEEEDRAWLDAAIGLVEANTLWGDNAVPPRYRELLSARDLPYIARHTQTIMTGRGSAADDGEAEQIAHAVYAEIRQYLEGRETR